MATVTKDFRVKHGLVVEGTNATVDGSDIITEDAIVGGTQTNITVTYNPTTKVVDFVAENGVADSTTDDLEEGETNLYFTDQRAIDAVGGSATPNNEPNTVVKRDANGDFAAENVTVEKLKSSDGTTIFNSDGKSLNVGFAAVGFGSGGTTISDDMVTSNELRTYVLAKRGSGSDVYLGDNSTVNNLIATKGDIDALDTDDIEEGTTNLYYTDTRVRNAVSAGDGLDYNSTSGEFSADLGNGLQIDGTGQIEIDNNVVATQTDLSDDIGAHSDLTTGVHGVSGDVVGTTDSQTLSNKTLGTDLNAGTYKVTNLATPTAEADAATKNYVDSAISNLVDGAPALLDTLNELAAALGDDENFAATVATDIGTKVSKAGDSMTGALAMGTNKITGLGTPTDDYDAATKKYTDDTFVTLEDLPGQLDEYVLLTQKGAIDGVATLDGAAQVPLTQLENVTDVIDALTTDEIAEGTNLYFTDVRAVDALEAVVPNFTAVEVNSVAKQVAATVSAPTSGDPVTAYAFAKATYRSAKFLVKVAYSTHTEVSEVLLTLDTSDNIAITEFAIVSTNGSASGISAGINGSNVELLVTPTNASSTVTVVGTLLA
jgi:hypothetical protein